MTSVRRNRAQYHFVLFDYWFALVVWQNVRSAGNRSTVDVLIKAGLLLILILFFLQNHKLIIERKRFLCLSTVSVAFLVTACLDSNSATLGAVISYMFPLLFAFLTIVLGADIELSKSQFLQFLQRLVVTVLYMVIYAVLFCTDQFVSAFSISGAYGNELSSFFVSSMEYGLYLVFGITACILILQLREHIKKSEIFFYYFCMLAFSINLILTFNRTSILGCLMILMCMLVFSRRSKVKNMLLLASIAVVTAIMFSEKLNNFVFNIVFKGNAASGRDTMFVGGLKIYAALPTHQKLFGVGLGSIGALLRDNFSHSNVHNGYLQALLSNGILGAIILITISILNTFNNFVFTIREHEYRNIGAIFFGCSLCSLVYMAAQTCTLFYSNIDAYFLTVMTIVIPMYVRNAIVNGNFE